MHAVCSFCLICFSSLVVRFKSHKQKIKALLNVKTNYILQNRIQQTTC